MECIGPDLICAWQWLGENVASIIAASAMAAAFWQGYIARRHNKLSVKPYLTIHPLIDGTNDKPSIGCSIANQGLGPAEVIKFTIKLKGEALDFSMIDQTTSKLEEHFRSAFSFISNQHRFPNDELNLPVKSYFIGEGSMIAQGKEEYVFEILSCDDDEISDSFDPIKALELYDDLEIEIKYTCLYGDKIYTEKI
ncbi:hypothetical protein ACMXYQ_12470 [Neptuniibacter sp. PT34_22]|uniref:hypothetical protein n=1 Tax=Neptuniibacter sp. PT34_22 TaxID=3398205 RepID=UPI0039F5AC79